MNWFKEHVNEAPLVKTAESEKAFFADESDDAIAANQVGKYITLFNAQRYVMDSYTTKVALSKTKTKYAVSLMTNHNFLGGKAGEECWTYGLDEFDKARDTYERLNIITGEVSTEFIEKEMPTSIYWPVLRARIEGEIDDGSRNRTNIPSVNYSRKVVSMSPDWRENIYGPRYPQYSEGSEKDYIKFWATQTGR